MQQSQKAAAKTKSQSCGGFRRKEKSCVVDLKLFQGVLDPLVLFALCRIDTAVNHGLDFFIARHRFRSRVFIQGDGVAHPGVPHLLDAGADIAYLAGPQGLRRHMARRHNAYLGDLVLLIGIHQADGVAHLYLPVKDTGINDYAFVIVVYGIKDEGFQLAFHIALRCRNMLYHCFQKLCNADSFLGRYQRRL